MNVPAETLRFLRALKRNNRREWSTPTATTTRRTSASR